MGLLDKFKKKASLPGKMTKRTPEELPAALPTDGSGEDVPQDKQASLGNPLVARSGPRPATSTAPQLFTLLVDNSGSMDKGGKAEQATEIVHDTISRARTVSTRRDPTGKKHYFHIQIIKFANECDDVTKGMGPPPVALEPESRYAVRHPDNRGDLGHQTNLAQALELVYKSLKHEVKNKDRIRAAMPEPVVLVVTDGLPNLPGGWDAGQQRALEVASRIKSLELPAAEKDDPVHETRIHYPKVAVKVVAIGVGEKTDIDESFLRDLATHVDYFPGGTSAPVDLPLYLYCPEPAHLAKIGAQIVGSTITERSDDSDETLEDVLYRLRGEE